MKAIIGRTIFKKTTADHPILPIYRIHRIHRIKLSQWKKQVLVGDSQLLSRGKKRKGKEDCPTSTWMMGRALQVGRIPPAQFAARSNS